MSSDQGLVKSAVRLLDAVLSTAGVKAPPADLTTASKKMAAQLWDIGVLPPDVTEDQLKDIEVNLHDRFAELGIEPLTCKSKGTFSHDGRCFEAVNVNFHDEIVTKWKRRSLAAFLNPTGKNQLPRRVVEIVHSLQKAGLPLSASLEVMVPSENTASDPILMVSFCDRIIILLCRWSNNVG
jgi:hypothetical protein